MAEPEVAAPAGAEQLPAPVVTDATDDRAAIWAEMEAKENPPAQPAESVDPALTSAAPETPTDPAKPTTETAPAAPTPAAAEPDPWTGATLTPAQTAALEKLRAEKRKADDENKAFRGRQPTVQAENERLKRELATLKAAPAKPKTPAKEIKEITDDEWEAMKVDFPELGDRIERYIEKRLGTVRQPVEQIQQHIQTEVTNKYVATAEAALASAGHPDHATVVKTKEFADWYNAQPPYVQAAARDSQDPTEVSDILSKFKRETGYAASPPAPQPPAPVVPPAKPNPALSPRRTHQLESATSPRTATPLPAVNGVPDDPDGAWKAWGRLGH